MATQTNNLDTLPQRFRVGGSGFTAFQWMGHVIGFAQSVEHTAPQPSLPLTTISADNERAVLLAALTGRGERHSVRRGLRRHSARLGPGVGGHANSQYWPRRAG